MFNKTKFSSILTVLVLTLALTLVFAVSCSSDAGSGAGSGTADLTLSVNTPMESETKGLTAIVDKNIASSGTDAYYWAYRAVKKDSYGKTGEQSATYGAALNGSSKGLNNISNLSVGKWEITLFAYQGTSQSTAYNTEANAKANIVYASTPTSVEIKANTVNNITLSVNRVQWSGTNGILSLDPKNISVALDSGTVAVTKTYESTENNVYIDPLAYTAIFDKLVNYSYRIVLCKEDWSEQTVLVNTTADVAQAGTGAGAIKNTTLAAGMHNLKIEVVRKDRNEAEKYVAMMQVDIYSNCTTTIANDGDGDRSGIVVKRIKEFNIIYKDWDSTDNNKAFSGTHAMITVEQDDGTLMDEYYPEKHQYGRTELLDEPTKEGYGFAGYYTTYNGSVKLTSIPAYNYADTTVYAKWAPKRYVSITYENDFPAKAVVTTGTNTTGATLSTTGEEAPAVMPTNPEARGYTFKGWFIDNAHKGYTNANGLPGAWNADMNVLCKAQWEPIHYKVDVRCHSSINPATDFENYAEISAQVARLKTSWSSYDVEYSIIDPITTKYGFIGYKRGNSNASDASNYTYEAAKMERSDGKYENLTAENNDVVYLYALFSDYFTPLEYIRSYPASSTSGPVIDSGLMQPNVSKAILEMELAGAPRSAEVIIGADGPPWNLALATISNRNGRWWDINGSRNVQAGLYFEDQKYVAEVSSGASGSYIKVDGETLVSDNTAVGVSTRNVHIFGSADNYKTDMRLYSCNMYNAAGKIVRRFQPCVLKATVPAAFSSDGAGTHTAGEIGLWDIVTNKFYPNKGSGRFYQPSEEVTITLNNVVMGDFVGRRTQKVLKGVAEKLHKNLFSRANSKFLGWGSTVDASTNAYEDEGIITANADVELFVRWSKPVSYNLFNQVEWLGYRGTAYTKTDEMLAGSSVFFSMEFKIVSAYKSSSGRGWQSFFGSRHTNATANAFAFFFYNEGGEANRNQVGIHAPLRGTSGDMNFGLPLPMNEKLLITADTATGALIYEKPKGTYNNWPFTGGGLSLEVPILIGAVAENGSYGGSGGNPAAAYQAGYVNWDLYGLTVSKGGVDTFKLVPCVLAVDLTSSNNVTDATGATVKGNTKVYTGKNCSKGEAGLWDLVSDRFYPFTVGSGVVPETYQINYSGNGGLGNMESQIVTTSTSYVRLLENRYQNPGYEFIGWKDGSGDWYSDQRMIHNSELKNMMLFAQWREVPASVPYEVLDYIQNEGPRLAGNDLAFIDTLAPFTDSFRYRIKYRWAVATDGSANVLGFYNGGATTVHHNSGVYLINKNYKSLPGNSTSVYEVDAGRYNNLVDVRTAIGGAAFTEDATGQVNATAFSAAQKASTWGLFGYNPSKTSDKRSSRVYYFRLWDENERMIRDYIPVLLTEDIPASKAWDNKVHYKGELGMWDKCENKFYSNANGSGYFGNNDLVLVQFNANGGTGTMADQTFKVTTEKIALKANAFTKSGSKFIGWNTAADGTGIWYHDKYETNAWKGGTVYVLYAQWDNTGDVESVRTEYFEPVNYIVVPQGAYIDTGLYPSPNFAGTMHLYQSSTWGYSSVIGANNGSVSGKNLNLFQFPITVSGNQGFSYYYAERYISTSSGFSWGDMKVVFNKASITFNGTTSTVSGTPNFTVNSNNNTITLGMTRNVGDSRVYNSGGIERLHYLKLTAGEDLRATTDKTIALVPCRLKKKISTYEAGTLAADESTHIVGEVGMWDLVENKFYGNASSTGVLTCEFSN